MIALKSLLALSVVTISTNAGGRVTTTSRVTFDATAEPLYSLFCGETPVPSRTSAGYVAIGGGCTGPHTVVTFRSNGTAGRVMPVPDYSMVEGVRERVTLKVVEKNTRFALVRIATPFSSNPEDIITGLYVFDTSNGAFFTLCRGTGGFLDVGIDTVTFHDGSYCKFDTTNAVRTERNADGKVTITNVGLY